MARMQDVELVEDDEPGEGRAASSDADASPRRGRLGRRLDGRLGRRLDWRWWLVPVAVVLVGVLAQQGLDAYHRHLDARYAHVPGLVDRVESPLRAAWRADDPLARSMSSGAVVGDLTVAADVTDDGSTVAVAFDLRTGRRAWQRPLQGADPRLIAQAQAVSPYSCVAVRPSGGGVPTQVACLSTDEATVFPTHDNEVPKRVAGTAAHVVVLDAATGEQAASLTTTPAEGLDVVGDVVVLGHQENDGTTTVRALGLATGRVLWQATTGARRAPDIDPTLSGVGLWAVADEVLVLGEDGVTRLALADGTRVAPAQPYLGIQWAPDRSRAWLTTQLDDGTIRAVLVAGIGHDVVVPGTALSGPVDDGSVPGLVLAGADGLAAYDATTGARRWTAPVRVTTAAAVFDGTVYVTTDDGVAAIDGRTGAVRWQASLGDAIVARQVFTDGFRVLVASQDTASSEVEHVSLAALDKRDGHVVWNETLPQDADGWVVQVGRALLGVGVQVARLGG